MAYVLPQVQVFQVFTQLPQSVVKNLNAFVFGPHYQLFRYDVEAEKAVVALGAYDKTTDVAYSYPGQPTGSTVDNTYTKLYADSVWAKYASFDAADLATVKSSEERNKIRVANLVLKTTTASDRSAVLKSRDVKVGDRVRYTSANYGSGVSTVIALEADEDAAAVDTATGSGTLSAITSSGSYSGAKSTTYTLVVASATQIKITDSAGIDGVQYVTPVSGVAFDVGAYGAKATVTFASLTLGDTAYIPCTIAVATDVKTMVLADDVLASIYPDEAIAVDLFLLQASVQLPSKNTEVPGTYNWKEVSGDLTVYGGIAVQDPSFYDTVPSDMPWLPVDAANLYVEYRALLTDYSDTIHSLDTASSVAATLGTVHPDNPLAQGVYNALLNSGNRAVYYMAVASNDLVGFSTVLDRATLSSDVYAFAPLSRDSAILDAVTSHINLESTETEKRWRIGFYGATLPTSKTVYAVDPAGDDVLATVTSYNSENVLVKFVDAAGNPSTFTKVMTDVKVGDKVRVGFTQDLWGDATYDEYEVASLLTNASLLLTSGPAAPIAVPSKVEVIHPYSTAEMADAMAFASYGFYNRRVYNVFPSQLSQAGVAMTGEFGAAAVAGLCSSVPPQQGLTNVQLLGFDDLPMVYSTFTRTQLNKMAEYGTLIIMQDVVNGPVYIRHQVSTKSFGKNLNETELSMIKNLDSISYYFAERLAPYIGIYNVTGDLLAALKTSIYDALDFLGSYTSVGLLGPQIELDNTEIVTLQQHPVLKDTILCSINLGLPAPLNVVQLTLVV